MVVGFGGAKDSYRGQAEERLPPVRILGVLRFSLSLEYVVPDVSTRNGYFVRGNANDVAILLVQAVAVLDYVA